MPLEEIRELISGGKKLSLIDDYLYQGRMFIPKTRILQVKDIDRLENHGKRFIKVVEAVEVDIKKDEKDIILRGILKFFDEHPHYKGINEERKDVFRDNIANTITHTPYVASKLSEILKVNKKLGFHCIHVAIKSMIINAAYQNKYNQGMFDGLELENIICGALIHDYGYIVQGQELLSQKRLDILEEEAYSKHPMNGYEALLKDSDSFKLHPQMLNIVRDHEERLDGSGFPAGKNGADLHYTAQIVGLANSLELYLTNEMTVSKMPVDKVLGKFARSKEFDGKITAVMVNEFSFLYHS